MAPPFGALGTLTRNAFHLPGINNFDVAVLKNFAVSERIHLQMGGGCLNIFYAAAARTAICRAGGRNTLSSRLKANTATAVSSITAETGNKLQAALA